MLPAHTQVNTGAMTVLDNRDDPRDPTTLPDASEAPTSIEDLGTSDAFPNTPTASVRERYEMLEALGSGGTSVVYKAFDRATQKVVALKVFSKRDFGQVDLSRRMSRELRLTRMINSEHVATLYELGETPNNCFFVMEHVPGRPLSEEIEASGPLPEERVMAIADDALDGIAAAHALGIVHRDLKPSNLMITPEGKTVVLDFGLARKPEDVKITREDQIIGTPAYISPSPSWDSRWAPHRTSIPSAACSTTCSPESSIRR